MFKKLYKEANNSIKPNRDLIDEIYKKYDRQKSGVPLKRIYRYSAYAAAALAIAVCVYSYPQIAKFASLGNSGIEHTATTQNETASKTVPNGGKSGERAENAGQLKKAEEDTADFAAEQTEKNSGKENTADNASQKRNEKNTDNASQNRNEKNALSDEKQGTKEVQSEKAGGEKKQASTQEKAEKSAASEKSGGAFEQTNALNEAESSADNAAEDNAALEGFSAYMLESGENSENDLASALVGSSASGGGAGGSGVRAKNAGGVVVWSMDKYCEYLGVDLTKIDCGSGFKSTAPNEVYISESSGDVVFDTATLNYACENKLVTITVSKIQRLMPQGLKQSGKVNGISVYTDGGVEPTFYLENKGVGFAVYCRGLSKAEQSAAVESVCGL